MTWLQRYTKPLLILIIAFAFVTRIYNLHLPKAYVFDEVYHALTAKLIARNDTRAYEWWNPPVEPNTAVDWLHPPLAKYTQAIGILVFGENAFGWRISSALFGVGVIILVYVLAQELFKDPAISLTSALLASLDGLLLVQSRVAMNDIHVTFLILLTMWCFLQYRQSFQPKATTGWGNWRWMLLTGISAGLAVGTKWSGIFILGLVGSFEGLQLIKVVIKDSRFSWLALIKHVLMIACCWLLVPAILYLLAYSHMFLQGKTINHFQEMHRQIWWYQTTLNATHAYQSRPWEWFLNLKPVWYYVEYLNQKKGNIYALGNPLLFWLGDVSVILTGVMVVASGYDVLRQILEKAKRWKTYFQLFPLSFLLLAYLIVWLPWQLSPRIMFFYHYTPAVPLLSIILAYWLITLAKSPTLKPWGTWLAVSAIICIASTFAIFYPHWTGLPVSIDMTDQIYFAIPTWK